MKTTTEVRIGGEGFTVTSENEQELVLALAQYVDNMMKKIGESFPTPSPVRVAIMTAFAIADQFAREKAAAVKSPPEGQGYR